MLEAIQHPLTPVLIILFLAIVLFVTNKVRMDVVSLIVIVAFVLSGTLTLKEATAGFSDPNVLLIAMLFVVGDGLVRTGVTYKMGDLLISMAANSEVRVLVMLMVMVAFLGSVMSSTGIVAIFIPAVVSVCIKMKISPRQLMMPLSFAGLISGMMTLIATPPNLVINSEFERNGLNGFSFFDITPIGILVLLMGIGYMLVARKWLGKENVSKNKIISNKTMRDLIKEYQLSGRSREVLVKTDSRMIGRRLDELKLRSRYGIYVIGIQRWRRFRRVMVSALGDTEIKENDILLVDIGSTKEDLKRFCEAENLQPMISKGDYFSEQAREIGMAEISIVPESEIIGKTLKDIAFRSNYNLNAIGLKRQGKYIIESVSEEILQIGDILLVIGGWEQIKQIKSYHKRDFIVLSLPVEAEQVTPAANQAAYAVLSIFIMVMLMISEIVPHVIAALIACLLMGRFRCITMESAYKAIHWPSLILIVGMLPFATALQNTGGIDLAVSGLMGLVGESSLTMILISLFILTAVTGLFISNTATAVLMAPVAIATANYLHVSPYPFAMTVAIAASCAFMTPISSPVNTMVVSVGQYTFADFFKIGAPFTLLVMIVSIFIIPVLFPF